MCTVLSEYEMLTAQLAIYSEWCTCVPAGVQHHDKLVPLRAVSHCELYLSKGEMTGA